MYLSWLFLLQKNEVFLFVAVYLFSQRYTNTSKIRMVIGGWSAMTDLW